MADEGVARLVVAKIFVADVARGYEPVGAGLVKLDEQAGARDAGNMTGKGGADAVGQEMCDQAIRGLTFGLHGAALGGGNVGGDLGEGGDVRAVGQTVTAELAG